MANINPNQKEYKNLSKFKFFTLTNFPFIEADFDAITNYELMCKIVEYLNGVIENEQNVSYNVQQLYNAFMELQAQIDDELAEQNQRIDDYFEDTNIQAFVDNRINEMIANDEFQALLQEAILEINPNALKDEKRINNLNFGGTLIQDYSLENLNESLFLSSTMKPVILNILNNMRNNNELYYYFTNGDEDANTMKLFKFDITNIENGSIYLYVYYWMNYLNLNNPTVLWMQNFNVTITDDVVTDITIDYGSTSTRTLYTSSGGSGGSAMPLYEFSALDYDSYILFGQYGSFNIVGDDVQPFIDILNDAHEKGFVTFLLKCNFWGISTIPNLIEVSFKDTDFTSSFSIVKFGLVFDSNNYDTSLAYGRNNNGTATYLYNTYFNITDGAISSFHYLGGQKVTTNTMFLPVNNTETFVPTGDYQPSTKKYTDDKSLVYSYGSMPYTAGTDFTLLPISFYSSFRYGDAVNPILYDVQLYLDSVTNNLTGDVILATTPHAYAGFTVTQPPSSGVTQAWTGIAVVHNNSSDSIILSCDARFSPVSNVWEIHMLIPTGTTLTTGASISVRLTYMRATI